MLWQPPPKVVVNTSVESTSLWQPRSPSEYPASPTSSIGSWGVGSRNIDKIRVSGRRFGQIIRLKKDHVNEYKTCHAKAWPEVLKQIKDCKIEDCKLHHKRLGRILANILLQTAFGMTLNLVFSFLLSNILAMIMRVI